MVWWRTLSVWLESRGYGRDPAAARTRQWRCRSRRREHHGTGVGRSQGRWRTREDRWWSSRLLRAAHDRRNWASSHCVAKNRPGERQRQTSEPGRVQSTSEANEGRRWIMRDLFLSRSEERRVGKVSR